MDNTALFKACVKTVRTRNKAFGVAGGDSDKNKILGPRIQRSGFTLKAKEVVNSITRLKDFLIEHRIAYLNFAGYLSDVPQMSDAERDKIDAGAQRIMNTCSHSIQDFKKECIKMNGPSQLNEHRQNVIGMIENYLKSVCKIYSEQRAIRVKRTIDMQKMNRLETDGSPLRTAMARKNTSDSSDEKVAKVPRLELTEEPSFVYDETENLSPEELQMFEQENEQLFNELNSLSEEVRQIESKVVQVAELQEIFTEKVLQQEVDIDRIATAVVGTTENVKDGNEQIRQAIQRNAGLRVFILFFLLVMSFSLLFLDWYND
jgi:syntaxin 18